MCAVRSLEILCGLIYGWIDGVQFKGKLQYFIIYVASWVFFKYYFLFNFL